jgi:hypothetical protein
MDYEYMSLMAELGEGPPPPQGTLFSCNLICLKCRCGSTQATVLIRLSVLGKFKPPNPIVDSREMDTGQYFKFKLKMRFFLFVL